MNTDHQKILIDFERLFAMENIPVARPGQRHYHHGWVSLPCPFCKGGRDGNHLGYSPKYKVFTCWRCGRHTVGEVLAALLGKPKRDAVQYALERYPADAFSALREQKTYERPYELELIGSKTPDEVHVRYLNSRHIDTDWLVDRYDARFTKEHKTHRWRVILPIWHTNRYVSYVGRDVTGEASHRYLTCFPENEVYDIKLCLFGMQRAIGDTVIVVEGPFDALRIGEGAIATLGSGWKNEQARLIGTRFRRSYILFDAEKDAIIRARKLAQACMMFNNGHKSSVITLSGEQGKDPGELPEETLVKLRELIHG